MQYNQITFSIRMSYIFALNESNISQNYKQLPPNVNISLERDSQIPRIRGKFPHLNNKLELKLILFTQDLF